MSYRNTKAVTINPSNLSNNPKNYETVGYINFYMPYETEDGEIKRAKLGDSGLKLVASDNAKGQEVRALADALENGSITARQLIEQILASGEDMIDYVPVKPKTAEATPRRSLIDLNVNQPQVAANG